MAPITIMKNRNAISILLKYAENFKIPCNQLKYSLSRIIH